MTKNNKKTAALGLLAAGLVLIGGVCAVLMDAKKIDLTTNVGTLDLSADAVFTHANAYAATTPAKNTGLFASNLNPGDNDHTVNSTANSQELNRDGSDHELNIHIQNDGNKSLITRTLLLVTGKTDGIHNSSKTVVPLSKYALKNVLLYLAEEQSSKTYADSLPSLTIDRLDSPTNQIPAGVKAVAHKVWATTRTTPAGTGNARYQLSGWTTPGVAVANLTTAQANQVNSHTSPDNILSRTITANERTTKLKPTDTTGVLQKNTGKTEKLEPLNAPGVRPAYWSDAEINSLIAPANPSNTLLYEVHRNMVLGGAVKAPGVTEYETLEVAMGKTTDPTALAKSGHLTDKQPYIAKRTLESAVTNMIPSSKEFIIDVGLDHRVGRMFSANETINGQAFTAGSYFYPELEGATINIRVIVQAFQFRDTSDVYWKTLFSKDTSLQVAY